ncbi:hypothetical protein JB92DRAFT_250293 [Gautieria morchelliformis]|nr:hypothetical protein JB92DRAFT_250293 [Gautieria morchelliformis]
MNKRPVAFSTSIPQPQKRLRRTATTVLAGYFDPRPHRDYFTDMANSSDSQSPYDSIVGHGPGILFDVRPQEEKDKEMAREQKRLLKNAKRREKDIEKRKEKQEQKLRKAQKRVARVQTVAHPKSAHRAEDGTQVAHATARAISPTGNNGGADTLAPFAIRTSVIYPPGDLATGLSPIPAGPSSGRSPYNTSATGEFPPSSQRAFIYDSRTALSREGYLQTGSYSHTLADLTPGRPAIPSDNISAVPSASAAFASPPTPGRSISSITSHTSSKRPNTPEDDQMSPALTHKGSNAYSPIDIDEEDRVLDHNSVEESAIDQKAATTAAPEHERYCERRSPVDTRCSTQSPYSAPTWFLPQSPRGNAETGGKSPWKPSYSSALQSQPLIPGSPAAESNPQRSTSHRRDSLSLAALLSPISHFPKTLVPSNETPELRERCNHQDEISVQSTTHQHQEPSVSAPSTVESSCLSPLALASPLNGEIVASTVGGLPEPVFNKIILSPAHGHSLASAVMDIMKTPEELPKPLEITSLEPAIDLESSEATYDNCERESGGSATPEPDRKNRGRASKAMLVFQSEDELTDFEDLDTTRRHTKSATDGDNATGDKGMASDGFSLSKSAVSPAANVASKKRKRAASKKGWKGWVEVEVDEGRVPPKQFSLDILPPGERRTRSGRQFDG